ncbi:MAG: transglycosylase SLT domain-containing protein [Deltaproteobacteria bacterium]|nr:transglycosylase SLT domain-containing protein [Deltaproteobacteria bacterium]
MRRAFAFALLVLLPWPRPSLASEGIVSEEEEEEESGASAEDAPPAKSVPVPFDTKWIEPCFPSGPQKAAVARFRSRDFAGAAKDLGRVLARLPKSAPERNPLRLLLALALMNQQSWQAAGEIFEDLWSTYPLLAPYHAYHAARCRLRDGDSDGAFTWLSRVPSGSVIEPDAAMVKVDAFVATKRWEDVEAEVDTFLGRFPKGPRRAEAMFLRAEALRELGRPPAETAAAYRKVWAESKAETWAARANERLETLARTVPPEQASALVTRSIDEQLARGMILYDSYRNADAEAVFAAALATPAVDKATLCKLRFHLAQSVWKQRQRQRAAPLFDLAIADCRAADDKNLTVRSLYQGARSYATAGDKEKALALYAQIENDFARHRLADDARLRAAEVFTGSGKEEEAARLLDDLAETYPKGDMGPESLWRLAFESWRDRAYDKTLARLDEILRRYPREDIWYAAGRALYWKARVLEKKAERKRARASYERAVREYPLSVYTLFSLERMRRSFPEARTSLMRELRKRMGDLDKKSPWDFGKQAVFGEPGFRRAVEFARLGLGSEARRELGKLGLRAGGAKNDALPARGREDVYWITAILLDASGQWHASHSIPRRTLTGFRRDYPNGGRHEAEWRLAYPKAFPDEVAKHSRANGVPEALQWAIMREESSFYPRAESFANALGLTQMMTRTAGRFAPWPVTREALFDPDKNLEVGSKFLAFLLARYGGQVPLVISGYNAGEGAVDRWLRERGNLELDEFIESIPYDETRGYTKRVLSSFLAYSWLYQPKKPVPPLGFALKKPASGDKSGNKAKVGKSRKQVPPKKK